MPAARFILGVSTAWIFQEISAISTICFKCRELSPSVPLQKVLTLCPEVDLSRPSSASWFCISEADFPRRQLMPGKFPIKLRS